MDEKKLELTLGLPGNNYINDNVNSSYKSTSVREKDKSLLSLGYFKQNNNGVIECEKDHRNNQHSWVSSSSSSCCCEQQKEQTTSATIVPITSQKRAAPAPVVGWPPVRSFRKNLASTSTGKTITEPQSTEPQSTVPSKPVNEAPINANANATKGQFVKINMDGVPIGRKVDLSAYNNYDSLSSAVDKLFRGLLAAQRDSSGDAKDNKQEEEKPITGLLYGSGEYTLVYEDNEGDKMLVGDVPWHMFVSTVKRLRVLKSSDLPIVNCGGNGDKILVDKLSNQRSAN